MPFPLPIQNLIDKKCLTEKEAQELSPMILALLSSRTVEQIQNRDTMKQFLAKCEAHMEVIATSKIGELIEQNQLTVAQILWTTDDIFLALANPDIHALIKEKRLTVDQVLRRCNDTAIPVLMTPDILALIRAERLTADQVLHANSAAIDVVMMPDILALIREGRLPVDQVLEANEEVAQALGIPEICSMLKENELTFNQVLKITNKYMLWAFQQVGVCALLREKLLTFDQALDMSKGMRCGNFNNPELRRLIREKQLTVSEALNLSYDAIQALEKSEIVALSQANLITVEHLFTISSMRPRYSLTPPNAIYTLASSNVIELISADFLTVDQILAMNNEACKFLSCSEICTFIKEKQLTGAQVSQISEDGMRALVNPKIKILIDLSLLTVDQALQITSHARLALENPMVLPVIFSGQLTIPQFLHLTPETAEILHTPDTRQRFMEGQTFEEIIAAHYAQGVGAAARPPIINRAQSTHTTSVHRTVSESATRLFQRYHARIKDQNLMQGQCLNDIIRMVQIYIDSLPGDINSTTGAHAKNSAAKRAILRLTAKTYAFTDPGSGISTRQLIALCFLAIHDQDCLVATVDEARAAFVDGLYQVQREYNFSQAGDDQGGEDYSPMCDGGTFNKFIEKLSGIHSDCIVQFITPEVAAFKLPSVVREETRQYLKVKANPQTLAWFLAVIDLIAQLNQEGVSVIWSKISTVIAERMFEEFSSLYNGRRSRDFIDSINTGEYVLLTESDLTSFQKPIQVSAGYQKYCSLVVYYPLTRFFAHAQLPDEFDDTTHAQKVTIQGGHHHHGPGQ